MARSDLTPRAPTLAPQRRKGGAEPTALSSGSAETLRVGAARQRTRAVARARDGDGDGDGGGGDGGKRVEAQTANPPRRPINRRRPPGATPVPTTDGRGPGLTATRRR